MNYEEFYKSFLNLTEEDSFSKNNLLGLLKEYSSEISVFDLMNLITQSDNTFEGVSEKWKVLGNKMQVETFIFRMKSLGNDSNHYQGFIDSEEFKEYIYFLKDTQEQFDDSLIKNYEIFSNKDYVIIVLSILYANYILEEPVHPEGTEFPGSQKVIEKEGMYYCPAKEGNLENPHAFCRLCIAEQLLD